MRVTGRARPVIVPLQESLAHTIIVKIRKARLKSVKETDKVRRSGLTCENTAPEYVLTLLEPYRYDQSMYSITGGPVSSGQSLGGGHCRLPGERPFTQTPWLSSSKPLGWTAYCQQR